MTSISRGLSSLRTLGVALVLALSVVRPAAAVDFTDLWWNSAENGWGVNFIQADNFIFATFFIYDSNQQPTWYSGQMTVDTNGVWSGPLFRTTGSYFGGPWNAAQRTVNQVGTVTFTPATSYAGTLTYNVNTTNVSKPISRQTLKTIPLGGSYKGGVVAIYSGCNDPTGNGTVNIFADFEAIQTTSGGLTLNLAISGGGTCSFSGAYVQDGQLYRINNAAYTCAPSFSSTALLSQVKATNEGLEGQWVANVGAGCQENGYFSGVLK